MYFGKSQLQVSPQTYLNRGHVFDQGQDGSKGDKGGLGLPGNPGNPGLRGKDVSKS